MHKDFFQVLRRVQKEESSKSSLARVDNDFYKQLRDYIKDLERSVANDPFGNEQLLLNNAQRIASEICERRESKITNAANINISRSFLLFKKNNPQFDLLDTTPLNLTDEEETLYFSLMDTLKNHRYRISLDDYAEKSTMGNVGAVEEEDYDEESSFVEDSYEESIQSPQSESSDLSDDLEEEISDILDESETYAQSESSIQGQSASIDDSSDEVLSRLNEIKDAKVITDEKYESIDKQLANQKYPSQNTQDKVEMTQSASQTQEENENIHQRNVPPVSKEQREDCKPASESSKRDSFVSDNIDDIFKNPDSQFVDVESFEPDYEDKYYDAIAAGSSYAAPSEDDFNMIFAKPKKPKVEDSEKPVFSDESAPIKSEATGKLGDDIGSNQIGSKDTTNQDIKVDVPSKEEDIRSDLGFSSGIDVKEGNAKSDAFNKVFPKEKPAPKKPVDKTRGGLFARDEIENTTVVISENIGEMVGIDGKIYGPFLANDVVILPNITAQILIDNKKASLVKL